jgi:hypothetical protein
MEEEDGERESEERAEGWHLEREEESNSVGFRAYCTKKNEEVEW